MRRRTVLKGMLAGIGAAGFRIPLAYAANYTGRFFVFVQADGGWDPTSFCDPKVNQKGERVINRWAKDMGEDDIPRAGDIPYAPWADNKTFFENHYDKMLVINGVDAQTNSHTAGVVHNWSGRISEGYPTMSALLAARYAGGMPVAYLNFGGYSVTGGVARFTRMTNQELLRDIAIPNVPSWGGEGDHYIDDDDWKTMASYRDDTTDRLVGESNTLPRQERNRRAYESAFESTAGLDAFANAMPPEGELEGLQQKSVDGYKFYSGLRRQAQLAVLAFKTGVAVSADLFESGGDTHAYHDRDHKPFLEFVTDGVDYLWKYARDQGIDERLVVVMGSDFGRTNHYNSDAGKDHWPYGSYIVMEKNRPSWTNRVVGETNELHHAYNIDPATLERVGDGDPNGTHIYPKHVHKALRKYLGIEDSPGAQRFPFNNTEDFAFFG